MTAGGSKIPLIGLICHYIHIKSPFEEVKHFFLIIIDLESSENCAALVLNIMI